MQPAALERQGVRNLETVVWERRCYIMWYCRTPRGLAYILSLSSFLLCITNPKSYPPSLWSSIPEETRFLTMSRLPWRKSPRHGRCLSPCFQASWYETTAIVSTLNHTQGYWHPCIGKRQDNTPQTHPQVPWSWVTDCCHCQRYEPVSSTLNGEHRM